MKTSLLALISLSALLATARPSEIVSAESSSWSYAFNHVSMSKYYGSIVGGIFYDGPMSFTDIIATRKDASGSTYIDLSLGQKLDSLSFDKDGGNEYDLSVGRTFTLGSADFPVAIDYRLTYLAVHHLRAMKDDVVSNALRVDLPKVRFAQPYLVIYRFDKVGPTSGSGWFAYGGFQRSDQIGAFAGKPLILGLEYRLGYSGTVFGTKPGLAYHRLSVSLTAELAGGWKVTPSLVGQTSGNGQPRGYAFEESARLFATVNVWKQL
jgi:hypothetical protein